MSGYDIKGILSRVRTQANYVQNHVLKNNDGMSNEMNNYRDERIGTDFSQPTQHHMLSQKVDNAERQPFTP